MRTIEEEKEYLREMIEVFPEKKKNVYRLRALEKSEIKADTPMIYSPSDKRGWTTINHVLKGPTDNPPDPDGLERLKSDLDNSKLVLVCGMSDSGKTHSAIIAADHWARKQDGPITLKYLDLHTIRNIGIEEFSEAAAADIVVVDALDFANFTPESFACFNEMLAYRELSPAVGPTIILSIQEQEGLMDRFCSPLHTHGQMMMMKISRAKFVRLFRQN